MDCKRIEELLPDYRNGELDPETHSRVDAHLSKCSECRSRLKGDESVSRFLNSLDSIESIESVSQKLLEKVKVIEATQKKQHAFSMSSISPAMRWGLIGAAILILVGIALLVFPSRHPQFQYFGTYGQSGFTWVGEAGQDESMFKGLNQTERFNPSMIPGASISALSGANEDETDEGDGKVVHTFDLSDKSN
jgi:hypothetical protein